ncbi:helix-turn-helix domain-containing protein [Hymenobacter negativus]|uniref:Helix-turn-helix transcriptional regulator n=1 Tax=Hymenobacter negativus TaxID=2795026 RepID=A0ABS0Q394_9BACT|nr:MULTISPECIES: helix-turn-helix domain-containing protein [Bacteria]MBH8556833.1 helix-turn-helix transcriptional regulator [Hymenobacter negativus]MBH8569081.1 helix-turn-helix transcriptional regulator [Hymenobacter negativus]MBR7208816.1 helix-turn-helix transcriptional regulator [Microvirga sp. STS02]
MIINTPEELRQAFREFDTLEAQDIDAHPEIQPRARELAEAIEDYELRMEIFPLPPKPTTLPAMIELKRQQQHLKQKELAALLEVPPGRLSQILSGKRRVTMDLAKKLYERLHISPEFILKTA